MAYKSTVKKFDEWKVQPGALDEFWEHIEGTNGKKALRFRNACVAIKRPYTLMYALVHGDERLKARYEAALAAKADDLMHERLEIANDLRLKKKKTSAEVMATKLDCDVRESTAKQWASERYGDRMRIDKTVTHAADAGLLGTASELLKKISAKRDLTLQREPRVLEGETVPELLPARRMGGEEG